ncbi:MAG: hypothetical protein LIO93_07305, partial [Bacteroidales bacterium]|nr:hypothetical protein [Bacteroidales bacterium]
MVKFLKSIKRVVEKFNFFFLISLSSFILGSCNQKNELSKENPQKLDLEDNFSDYYNYLPELILPYAWEENKYHFNTNYSILPAGLYSVFGDSASLNNVHIAKLPAVNLFKPILLYQSQSDSESVDLYSLSDSLKIMDHQRLASEEELNDKSKITQTFIITDKNQFKTFKVLNGTLIEQLYFSITPSGTIEEIRNGKLPFIAYETYNDSIYLVESFKWDKNSNGGLYKKDLSQKYYLLDVNGDIAEISETKIKK